MTIKDKVLEIFAFFSVTKYTPIIYDEHVISVEQFAYIIECADKDGVLYLEVLSAFDDPFELLDFAANLVREINKTIDNGSFATSTEDLSDSWEAEYPTKSE